MKLNKIALALTAIITMVAVAPVSANAQTINQRLHDQNKRIDKGIKNGSLSRKEIHNLRDRDRSIHLQERSDRLIHNGHLTAREHANLEKRLNRTSKAIYHDKHN